MDAKTDPFDPVAHGWEIYPGEGFIGLVGPFWMKREGESYRYGFLAEKKHHNRRGVVQGGMIMTFADRSLGMTAWYANNKQPQATVHLTCTSSMRCRSANSSRRSAGSCAAPARSSS